jgi:hypothetical protein
VFRNVGIQNSDAGELPRRKHTTYRTRQKFEIKKTAILSEAAETETLLFTQPTYTFNGKLSYTSPGTTPGYTSNIQSKKNYKKKHKLSTRH